MMRDRTRIGDAKFRYNRYKDITLSFEIHATRPT